MAYTAVKSGLVETNERGLLYEQAYIERLLPTRLLETGDPPHGDVQVKNNSHIDTSTE